MASMPFAITPQSIISFITLSGLKIIIVNCVAAYLKIYSRDSKNDEKLTRDTHTYDWINGERLIKISGF